MTQTRMIRDSGEDRPALDALNRTIGDLETRLNAIMESRRARSETLQPAAARADDGVARTPSRRPNRSAERPFRERSYQDPGAARVESELRDIARTLKDLRAALHNDFTSSLRDELSGLYDMLAHLDRQTDTAEIDSETRGELARVSDGIDWLIENASGQDDDKLIAEFEHLRTLIGGLADAKSIQRLEDRFDRVDDKLSAFDPTRLDDELITLAEGLEDVRHCLAAQDNSQDLRDIEDRLTGLARAMETLVAQSPAAAKKLDGQFVSLEKRIGDVDRSLERLSQQRTEAAHDPAIKHMDSKLGELADTLTKIDRQIQAQDARQSELVGQLQSMARQLEKHRQPNGYPQIEARLDRLAGLVENAGNSVDTETFANTMAALSGQFSQFDLEGAEQRIIGAINRTERDSNTQSLNRAIAGLSSQVSEIDLAGTERRLASKLDQTVSQEMITALDRRLDDRLDHLNALIEAKPKDFGPDDLKNAVYEIADHVARIDISGTEQRILSRLDKTASAETLARLQQNIDTSHTRLSGKIDSMPQGVSAAEMQQNTRQIVDTIQRIDINGAEQRLAARVSAISAGKRDDALHEKVDAMDMPGLEDRLTARILALDPEGSETRLGMKIDGLASASHNPALTRQFAEVATRLEAALQDTSGKAFRKIENQIGELTSLIRRADPQFPVHEMEKRLGERIETLSKTNDDYIIEAARYAAEEALKGARTTESQNAEHTLLKTLISDLQALHAASRNDAAEQRNELKSIISKIADRLDRFSPSEKAEFPATRPEASPEPPRTQEPAVKAHADSHAQEQEPATKKASTTETGQAESTPAAEHSTDDFADVLSVLNRVRARQMGENAPKASEQQASSKRAASSTPAGVRSQLASGRAPQGELIAAARRAARSAATAAEAAPQEKKNDNDGGNGGNGQTPSRRPVYLAASAILLAVLAYPLISRTASDDKPITVDHDDVTAVHTVRTDNADTPVLMRDLRVETTPSPTADAQNVPVTADAPLPVQTAEAGTVGEPAAFRIADVDRSISTGSIRTQSAENPFEAAASKALARRKGPITEDNPATRSADKAEQPVDSEEVLDMLSDTAPDPASGLQKAGTRPSEPAVTSVSQAQSKSNEDIAITVPAGLKPASLAAAASQGNPAALYQIGLHYEDGTGVAKDMSTAAEWFDRAAEKGSALAAFSLGSLYEKGNGVPQNLNAAIEFYQKAAEAGNIRAMHNLAVLQANGAATGTPDVQQAARWFKAAASHGVADSQFNLAILYARGAGVNADLVQSYKWFAIAAKAGDAEAAKRRDEVAEALSPEELKRGKADVAEWKPETPKASANTVKTPPGWQRAEASAKPKPVADKQAVIRDLQTMLNNQGYDAGPADGLLGKRTDAAIRAFQEANGFEPDGRVTPELVKILLAHSQA